MASIIQVLESHLAAKDPYTLAHQRRVAQIASTIAREMGLLKDQIDLRQVAGTIPTGWELLRSLELYNRTTQIVFQHHERLNGSGSPLGVSGEEILLEAGILGVTNAFTRLYSGNMFGNLFPSRGSC